MRKQIYILIIFIIGFGNAIADTIIAPPFDNFTLGLNAGVFFPIYQSNYSFYKDFDNASNPLISPTVGYKFGLSTLFKLSSNQSLKISINYSSFDYGMRCLWCSFENEIKSVLIHNIKESYIELPIEVRRILFNNLFNLDQNSTLNNLGVTYGLIPGYRTINEIDHTSRSNVDYKVSSNILKNKLDNIKVDLRIGIDLAQPAYLLVLSYNYPLIHNLSETSNKALYKNKSAYIMFHSINVDFTLFLFFTNQGKYSSIFD